MNNTYDIFRTPVYSEDTNLDNETMARYCLNLMDKDTGRKVSNEGGWQSNDLQGIHYPLNNLFKTITDSVNNFATSLKLPKQKIDNIWINVNGYRDYNQEHLHPNSHLSGVYYIQTHKDCGDIEFSNPYKDMIESYWWPHIEDNNDPSISGGMTVGSLVRVIRSPNFGKIGKVIELPPELRKMESETMVRVAIIDIGKSQVEIPRSNLEVVETD